MEKSMDRVGRPTSDLPAGSQLSDTQQQPTPDDLL
jgi:hypothetical protein